jgi:hypothetical protein
MQVVFKLYYNNEFAEVPCVGVQYRVIASNGRIPAKGVTHANGETDRFDVSKEFGRDTFRFVVSPNWESPKTDRSLDDGETTVDIAYDEKIALKIVRIRLLPFFKARLLSKGGKPLSDTDFTAYTIDGNGKEAVAVDLLTNKPIRGKSGSGGYTDRFYYTRSLVFKFSVPSTNIKVSSKRIEPMLPGRNEYSFDVEIPTSMAISQMDPATTANLAGTRPVPIIVSPQNEELIIVPQSAYDAFLEVSGELDAILAAEHQAKLNLSQALESRDAKSIEAAEKALDTAGKAVKKQLNKNFKTLADLHEVVTFERHGGGGNGLGMRRRYMRNDEYLKKRNARLNKTEFKLKIKFPGGAAHNVSVKPETLDVAALKESFKKIARKTSKEWQGDPKVIDVIEWAGNEYADTLVKSKTYEVNAQAQWLRLVSCGGANAQIDWSKKSAKVQGNWQAKAVLCEGKMTGSFAVPSLQGWKMQFKEVDLGAIRFAMELSLYGFAGAKIAATGAVGIALKNNTQTAYAADGDTSDRASSNLDPVTHQPRFDPTKEYPNVTEDFTGAKGEIDAFIGVEAGITPAGKIQWLPPQEPDFASFAEASVTGAVSAGAGGKLSFAVYYAGGKFRVSAAARLCYGVGCKGAVEFTVDGERICQFLMWMQYQLLHAGFRHLVYVSREAFANLARMVVLLIENDTVFSRNKDVKAWEKDVVKKVNAIAENIDSKFQDFIDLMVSDKRRQDLIYRINQNRADDWLTFAAPEVVGMILYQILYHGSYAHTLDTPSVGGSFRSPQIHYLPGGKDAINHVMTFVTTTDAWLNVMEHVSVRGTKNGKPAGKTEGDVLRYLNGGLFMPEIEDVFLRVNPGPASATEPALATPTGNAYVDKYIAIRKAAMGDFPKGYKVARIGTPDFNLLAARDGQVNPNFPLIRTAGLGEAYDGDPGSSLA